LKVETRKATFNLPTELLAALGDAVSKGVAPSKNALVERALVRELSEARRAERRARWAEAARDPLFLRDVDEIEASFAAADAETARQIR
jgi:Arc/MetJ-type ribon-helix-helix transcriptional regulator